MEMKFECFFAKNFIFRNYIKNMKDGRILRKKEVELDELTENEK